MQHGIKRLRYRIARPPAQIRPRLESPVGNHLAGIHHATRIKKRLDSLHRIEQFLAEVLAQERGLRDADAVFRRNGPLEFANKRRDFLRDFTECLHALGLVQIDDRTDMQQARSRVAV